jgi:hypothetical protein
MFAGSAEVGRDFCKTMITVCSGAIPIHIALVGLAAGKEFDFNFGAGLFAVAGPIFYLLAVGAFALGYFPSRKLISLEKIGTVAEARESTLDRRYGWATAGMASFGIGVVLTLAATLYFFSASPAGAKEPEPAAWEATWLHHLIATSDYRIDKLEAERSGGGPAAERAGRHLPLQHAVQVEQCEALEALIEASDTQEAPAALPAVCPGSG